VRYGDAVRSFEAAFADYVGARHAIGMTNGTVTIEVALRALGIEPGQRVGTTALTMAATSIAILNAGGVPVYGDVEPDTWLWGGANSDGLRCVTVSLYGLHATCKGAPFDVDDAAQTLRPHGNALFTSYSLQKSKILNTGEGGVLVTNDDGLAQAAREIGSLGYRLTAHASHIDAATLKRPDFDRHHRYPATNTRMNEVTAGLGLARLQYADERKQLRTQCAMKYWLASHDCAWLTGQSVPSEWGHDRWAYAVAADTPERALWLADAVERHGGTRPFFAWRITYQEPALRHLAPDGTCPIAEQLQPRILAFQTNDLASAERNARALARAIQETA
jgi:perosamine synthetase